MKKSKQAGKKQSFKKHWVRKACPIFLAAVASLFPWHEQNVNADTLDTSGGQYWYVRPGGSHAGAWDQTIGQGRNTPTNAPAILTVENNAAVSVTNRNAISLADNVTLFINGSVIGNSSGSNGLYGTGPNVIEGNSNMSIYVGDVNNTAAVVEQIGTTSNGEAINLHGFGNHIENYGTIRSRRNSAAIWFQDVVSSGGDPNLRNIVTNYGTIEQSEGKNVMGTSAGNGIIFHNKSGGKVIGNLVFSRGNDDLYFEVGSSVTGDINGGGGTNSLYLDGDVSLGTGILTGWVRNFQTLTKTGTGTWIMSGPLDGFTAATVDQGILRLTGNNTGYTGTLLINSDGTVEARAQSLPSNHPANGDTKNVTNNGTLRFIQGLPGNPNDPTDPNYPQNPNDTGTYLGQIVGSGRVEMSGPGTVLLYPSAPEGNTYSGGTWIKNGTVAIKGENALGSGGLTMGDITVPDATAGTLRLDTDDMTLTKAITLDPGGGVINTNGNTAVYSGTMSGGGRFTKDGDGTLILTSNDNFSAIGTTVARGTLQIGDGNNYGTVGGQIITVNAGAALAFDRSDDLAPYTKSITGDGRVIQRGRGVLELTDTNDVYTGGTELESGTVLISNADAYNKTDGSAANQGTNAGHFLYSSAETENSRTVEVDSGVSQLTNHFRVAGGDDNTFQTDGDLEISGVRNSSPDQSQGGAFFVDDGTLNMNLGGNLLLMDNSYGNGTSNDITVGSNGSLNINVQNADDTATINSGMSGSGTLSLIGPGTVALNADSGMGVTGVQNGTLRLNDVTYTSPSFTLDANGTLAGQGTVVANTAAGINGLLTPDGRNGKFGTLAIDSGNGATLMGSGYRFDYDVSMPDATDDWTNWDGNYHNDVLIFGSQTVTLQDGTINFRTDDPNGLDRGWYLIADSTGAAYDTEGNPLNDLFTTRVNGNTLSYDSPRFAGGYVYGGDSDQQIWFRYEPNSLTMEWFGGNANVDNPSGGTWVYNLDRMKSIQSNVVDGQTHYEYQFKDGDKVHLYTAPGGLPYDVWMNLQANLPESPASNVTVSGLVVGRRGDDATVPAGQGVITIKGSGGITADANSAYGIYVEGVAPVLTPTGKLEKFGDGKLVLSNTGMNAFLGGIDLYAGTTDIDSTAQDRLGVYVGAMPYLNAGLVTFKNGNAGATDNTVRTLSVTNNAQNLQNRFVVENNVTGANIVANVDTTLVNRGASSSITLDGGASLTLQAAVDTGLFVKGFVEGAADSTLNIRGDGFTQLERNSTLAVENFAGTTNVGGDDTVGKLRVIDGVTYGTATNSQFNLAKRGVLEGGGTIRTTDAQIGGRISPDRDTLTPDKKVVDFDKRQGVITFQGDGTTASALAFNSVIAGDGDTRDGFVFDYRANKPNTTSDANPTDTPNDLIAVRDMNTVTMNGGIINFLDNTPVTGDYLIIDSDIRILAGNGQQFREDGNASGTYLDGINNRPNGVLWGQVNGTDIVSGGPRGDFEFDFKNAAGNETAGKQIWLHVQHNTLQMVWQGGDGVWASGDWKSTQYTGTLGVDEVYDYSFFDGDLVYFNDTADPGESYTVTLDHNAIVSGVDVNMTDADSNVTIAGTGGITAIKANGTGETYIAGKYAKTSGTPIPADQEFLTTGKLVKNGAGIVTFANSGSNTFTEGIDINSGTVKFNDGRQLQVGTGKALTFIGNGTLQSTSTAKLETDIVINAGIDANFGTTQTSDILILDGLVSGPGNVEVTSGTVQLNRDSGAASTAKTGIENGTLRLLEGIIYKTDVLEVRAGNSILAGAGIYQADTTTINGRISPDTYKDDVIDGVVQPRAGDKFAKLTIDGNLTGSATLDGFTFDYDAKEPNTTTGVTDTPNDLLGFTRMSNVTIGNNAATEDVGTINFRTGDENYLATGKYLIVDSNVGITLQHSTTVTSPDDLLTGKITRIVNGAEVTTDFENLSARTWYAFRFNDASQDNEANLANSQIWLDAELNTLQMNLTSAAGGSFTWNTTDDVWSSRQVSENNVHETVFRNGDFAYLGNGDTSSDMTVALGGDVVASGLTAGRDSAGSSYDGNVTIAARRASVITFSSLSSSISVIIGPAASALT